MCGSSYRKIVFDDEHSFPMSTKAGGRNCVCGLLVGMLSSFFGGLIGLMPQGVLREKKEERIDSDTIPLTTRALHWQ